MRLILLGSVDCNHSVRANCSAVCTACTFVRLVHKGWIVAFQIYLLCQCQHAQLAGVNAKTTALALLCVNNNGTSYFCHFYIIDKLFVFQYLYFAEMTQKTQTIFLSVPNLCNQCHLCEESATPRRTASSILSGTR